MNKTKKTKKIKTELLIGPFIVLNKYIARSRNV